ncbi:hypothetical protein E3N88_31220 [Mikania micrantha]|uniref:Uncharacterized protein n=1 Tax=Mikania micrantha TaxID=192012 RepID=A0A5N6MPP4_9ASTR|nr:hypothetical protein E3N88_31220 [Mikania micrantha]
MRYLLLLIAFFCEIDYTIMVVLLWNAHDELGISVWGVELRGSVIKETSSWLGNGAGAETKKRKNRKGVAISDFDDLPQSKKIRHCIDDIEVEGVENSFSRLASGLDQTINGDSSIGIDISSDDHGALIPKRLRESGGRSKFGKSYLKLSASVENFAEQNDELKEVMQNEVFGSGDSFTPEFVKLNGKLGGKSRTKEKGIVGSKGNSKQGLEAVASALHANDRGNLLAFNDRRKLGA